MNFISKIINYKLLQNIIINRINFKKNMINEIVEIISESKFDLFNKNQVEVLEVHNNN